MEAEAVSGLVRITGESLQASIKVVAANAEVLKKLIAFIYAAFTSSSEIGKQRISKLIKQGKPLEIIRLPKESYKRFAELAKKYGIAFSAVNNRKDNSIDVLTQKEDVDRLMQVLKANEVPLVKEDVPKKEEVKIPKASQKNMTLAERLRASYAKPNEPKFDLKKSASSAKEHIAECVLKWSDKEILKFVNFDLPKGQKPLKSKVLEKLANIGRQQLDAKNREVAKGISASNKGIDR